MNKQRKLNHHHQHQNQRHYPGKILRKVSSPQSQNQTNKNSTKKESPIKKELKEGLRKCTDGQINLFARMYAIPPYNANTTIYEIVDRMPTNKLDWAIQQVKRTLEKHANANE